MLFISKCQLLVEKLLLVIDNTLALRIHLLSAFMYLARIALVLIVAISSMHSIFAQNASSIDGKLVDANQPVEFANVLVYQAADSLKIVKYATSDSLGNFKIGSIPAGKYLLKTQLMGYEPMRIPFTLEANQVKHLGPLALRTDSKLLASVEVISQKEIIQKTTQGFIIQAKDNLTQAGGSATDLLKSIPTVVVDADGAITVRGKGPMILINGRNSGISSTDLIPASSVASVEIINNPSAQYDADSEGGIINITLKKSNKGGTNVSSSVGGGYGAKGRGSAAFSINRQAGKWNVGLNYDMRYSARKRLVDANRISYDQPLNYLLIQHREDNRIEQTQNLKLNVDYALTEKDVINLEVLGNFEGQNNDEVLRSRFSSNAQIFTSQNVRESWEVENSFVAEFAATYSHQFEDKREHLSFLASTALEHTNQDTDIKTFGLSATDRMIDPTFWQRTYSYEKPRISTFKFDYSKPVSEKTSIDFGYKGIVRSTHIDFQNQAKIAGIYVKNPERSNIFQFNEQIHAAYLQVKSEPSQRFKYDVGLRAEQVYNSGTSVSNSSIAFNRQYFNAFPTANVAYYLNDADFIKFSYSKRINRPGLGALNPMIDITDSLNQHGGNPYLKPELVDAFEIGYSKEANGWSLSSSGFYRQSKNIIRPYIEMLPNGVAITKPQNFGNAYIFGVEEILTVSPTRYWSVNTSVSIFNQKIDGTTISSDIASEVLSWYGKMIHNFTISKQTKLQLIGIYNSPTAMPQGTRSATYNIDLGFQTKILKGKGGLGVVVSDIFNMQKSGNIASDAYFKLERFNKIDTRALFITFAYSFSNIFKESLLENKFSND